MYTLKETLFLVTTDTIQRRLKTFNFNVVKTAKDLNISRNTLYKYVNRTAIKELKTESRRRLS